MKKYFGVPSMNSVFEKSALRGQLLLNFWQVRPSLWASYCQNNTVFLFFAKKKQWPELYFEFESVLSTTWNQNKLLLASVKVAWSNFLPILQYPDTMCVILQNPIEQVEKDLWASPSPTLCSKQGQLLGWTQLFHCR